MRLLHCRFPDGQLAWRVSGEVNLGTSFSAANLNHGGSMEGIPPGRTGHRRA
jgi:hypothetical protein